MSLVASINGYSSPTSASIQLDSPLSVSSSVSKREEEMVLQPKGGDDATLKREIDKLASLAEECLLNKMSEIHKKKEIYFSNLFKYEEKYKVLTENVENKDLNEYANLKDQEEKSSLDAGNNYEKLLRGELRVVDDQSLTFTRDALELVSKISDKALKSIALAGIAAKYVNIACYENSCPEWFNKYMTCAERIVQMIPDRERRETTLNTYASLFGKLEKEAQWPDKISSEALKSIAEKYLNSGELDEAGRVALLIPNERFRSAILKELIKVFLQDDLNLHFEDVLDTFWMISCEEKIALSISDLHFIVIQTILNHPEFIPNARIKIEFILLIVEKMLLNNCSIPEVFKVAALIKEKEIKVKVYSFLALELVREQRLSCATTAALLITDYKIMNEVLREVCEAVQKKPCQDEPGSTGENRFNKLKPECVYKLINAMANDKKKSLYIKDLFKRYFLAGNIDEAKKLVKLIPDHSFRKAVLNLGRMALKIKEALALSNKNSDRTRNEALFKIFLKYIYGGFFEKANSLASEFIVERELSQKAQKILDDVFFSKIADSVLSLEAFQHLEELDLLKL